MGFGLASSVGSGCRERADAASPEWLDGVPVIPLHGSVFLDNLVRHRGQCRLVDWESFGNVDNPCFDLLRLLSALRISGETPDQCDGQLAAQIPALVQQYANGPEISVSSLPLLLPLRLAKWLQLQLVEGRKKQTEQAYGAIQHYFEQTAAWYGVLLGDIADGEEA
jgi:thiamine kinase-like enzyme